jgi:hypothetical protein
VVRALRSFLDEIDIVQLPDGVQIAVPRWMLDPVACSQLPQETKPRLSTSALLRLAELVHRHGLPVQVVKATSDASLPTKSEHVSKEQPDLSSISAAASQENALGEDPGNSPRPLSANVDPNVATAGARDHRSKEAR